jgi:hypothetical protein
MAARGRKGNAKRAAVKAVADDPEDLFAGVRRSTEVVLASPPVEEVTPFVAVEEVTPFVAAEESSSSEEESDGAPAVEGEPAAKKKRAGKLDLGMMSAEDLAQFIGIIKKYPPLLEKQKRVLLLGRLDGRGSGRKRVTRDGKSVVISSNNAINHERRKDASPFFKEVSVATLYLPKGFSWAGDAPVAVLRMGAERRIDYGAYGRVELEEAGLIPVVTRFADYAPRRRGAMRSFALPGVDSGSLAMGPVQPIVHNLLDNAVLDVQPLNEGSRKLVELADDMICDVLSHEGFGAQFRSATVVRFDSGDAADIDIQSDRPVLVQVFSADGDREKANNFDLGYAEVVGGEKPEESFVPFFAQDPERQKKAVWQENVAVYFYPYFNGKVYRLYVRNRNNTSLRSTVHVVIRAPDYRA